MVRHKRRYFVLSVQILRKKSGYIKVENLKSAIIEKVNKLYGEFGAATVLQGFNVKYCNSSTGIFYIRVNREVHSLVSAAIPLITSIGENTAIVSCIFKAATLRHANLFLKKYQERKLHIEKGKNLKSLKNKSNIDKNKRKIKAIPYKEKVLTKRKWRV